MKTTTRPETADAARSDAAPSGAATEAGNAAPTPEVRAMFDRISGVYDPMNLAISAFQEPFWRRRLVRATGLQPGMRALDVASGTGKVAADLQRRTQPGGRVVGIDISPGMIDIARRQYGTRPGLEYVVGDALALPTEDASFDAATIAFGMRNLPDYRRGFGEMARSVRPGGRVLCLEIARPRSRLARFMRWWFDRIVPLIGRVAGQGDAYSYLVRSVRAYPSPERIAEIMGEAGLVDVHWRGPHRRHRDAPRGDRPEALTPPVPSGRCRPRSPSSPSGSPPPGWAAGSACCSSRRSSPTSATGSRSPPGRCSSRARRGTRSWSRWRRSPRTCRCCCSACRRASSPTGSTGSASWRRSTWFEPRSSSSSR